jgi:Protein of unknown function (DUF992)
MMQRCLAAVAASTLSVLAPTARADVEIGVLTCTLAASDPAADAPLTNQRDALCTFQAKSGAEETYIGRFEGVGTSTDRNSAYMWIVKSASLERTQPGLLEQSYATDRAKPVDEKSPIIGEGNSDIRLLTMADEREGSASASEKTPPKGFVVIGVELKLKSTSG